jgi:hypothetical protein
MQIRSMILSTLFMGFMCTSPASAYTPADMATVTLTPGPEWISAANVLGADDSNTMKYEKKTGKIQIETLSKRQEKKPVHANSGALVAQMGDLLTKGLKTKGCESGMPMLEPQTGDNFKVWVQVFQCNKVKLEGLQYYVDADPQNIYLYTYTNNDYPFTPETKAAAEKEVKSLIQVCYNGKDCVGLQ